MTRKRKRLTAIEKAAIVRRHLADHVPVADLAEEHGIAPSQFYRWQNQLFSNLPGLFERKSDAPRRGLEQEIESLRKSAKSVDETTSAMRVHA